MSKINIPPIKEGFNLSQINAAFDTVEQHLNEKVLYRNNPEGEPNSMANDLDMNGKRVYNLPEPTSDGEAATLKTVKDNGVGGQYGKTLRTPESVNELPNVAGRANRLLSFDASGQPQVLFPSNDSATQLRIDLAAISGSTLVGYKASDSGNTQTIFSKLNSTISDKDYTAFSDAFTKAYGDGKALLVTDVRTIRIPSQAPNLQAVIDTCFKGSPKGSLTVVFDSGFTFLQPTLVEKKDCSWITLTSTDAEVNVSPLWVGQNIITAVNAFAPIWDILVNAAGAAVGFGLYIRRNSDCEVRPGKGVKNVNSTGIVDYPTGIIVVEASNAHIPESIFTGSYRNLWVSMSSTCNATGSTHSDCTGDYAVQCVRNSLLHLSQSTVNNAANNALYANNSIITFLEGEATGAGTALFAEYGGTIYTRPRAGVTPSISGSRINAVVATNGGRVVIEGSTINTTSGGGFVARDGGMIYANNTILTGISTTLLAYNSGVIVLTGTGSATTSSTSANNARAYQGGVINIDGATIVGGSGGVVAESGAIVYARGINISGQAANSVLASGGNVFMDSAVVNKATGNVDAILARRGGRVIAYGATVVGGRMGAHADTGGFIDAETANISGAFTNGIRATGGEINAQGATIRNNTGKDISLFSGGLIRIGGATTTNSTVAGTPNPTDSNVTPFNAISASGIIFG